VTDTPIYDQLRQELSSRRAVPDSSPPEPRARAEKPPAPAPQGEAEAGQPVSVWTLVNANRRKR
jgi:hypothetical protein